MNAESQDTGNPKQNISNYKPSIIFPFKEKPINDISGELSNYYWGAKLNDTNASMAILEEIEVVIEDTREEIYIVIVNLSARQKVALK